MSDIPDTPWGHQRKKLQRLKDKQDAAEAAPPVTKKKKKKKKVS